MRLTLHLTSRCNLECTYCYADVDCHDSAEQRTKTEMSLDTARRAVDFALAKSEKRAHLVFFGGEPTLRLDLVELVVGYARRQAAKQDKSVSFEITTNGSRVTDRFLRLVKRTAMVVSVSIDGPPEVHDTHRHLGNGNGSSTLVERGVSRLLDEAPWTIASAVVTPQTVGKLSASVEYLVERGFRVVMTSLDHSAAWSTRDTRVLNKQLERIAKRYVEWTRRGKKFYLGCLDGAIRTHVRGTDEPSAAKSCGAGKEHYSVAANGQLFPCVQFVSAPNAAQWAMGDLERGVDPEKAAAVLARLAPSTSGCSGCALEKRCASGCPCANFAATGRADQVSPVLCASQRASIPAGDKAASRLYALRSKRFIHKHYNRLYPVAECLEESLIHEEIRHAARTTTAP